MNNRFEGIIPPLTTPFSVEGDLQFEALERNLEKYLDTALSGFLALGSTGEAVHLTESEKIEVVRRCRALIPAHRSFLVGVSSPTLRHALEFIEKIAEFRIDAVLVGVPSYYKSRMTSRALEDYFVAIADRAPFPVLLYNVPQFTGLELSSQLIGTLSRHEKIVGMKESSGNLIYLQEAMAAVGDADFQFIGGSAETLGPAWLLGVRAGIYAIACAFPGATLEVAAAFPTCSQDLIRKQQKLFHLSRVLVARLGIAGIKRAMDREGYQGGSCRLPLSPLTETEKREVDELLACYAHGS